jgi:hypothetical protein
MFIDSFDGLEKYSAANIIGIRPSVWESIKKDTNLLDNAGHTGISRINWKKVVNMTTTSKGINKFDINIESSSQKHGTRNLCVFNLVTSDITTYPIPITPLCNF